MLQKKSGFRMHVSFHTRGDKRPVLVVLTTQFTQAGCTDCPPLTSWKHNTHCGGLNRGRHEACSAEAPVPAAVVLFEKSLCRGNYLRGVPLNSMTSALLRRGLRQIRGEMEAQAGMMQTQAEDTKS